MPINEKGEFIRSEPSPRRPSPHASSNTISQKNPSPIRQSSDSSSEMGTIEAIAAILAFVALIGLIGAAAYGAWIGITWLYDKAVKIIKFIYEARDIIIGLIALAVFSVIRSLFD